MSSQQHTPEPWKVFTVYAHPEIRDADDAFIASLPAGYVITARRIVACVNACAGLPTEELGAYKGYQISSGLQLIVMKQQRDELLAAIDRFIEHANEQELGFYSDGIAGLVTAVARVKGSAARPKPVSQNCNTR